MHFTILGNSLVRNLVIPNVEVVCINGLNWDSAVEYMMEHRYKLREHYVFIVVGPVRFTSLHKSRREVVFRDTNIGTITEIFAPFYSDLSFLKLYPVPCPIFPMNFVVYNQRCARPIMTSFYEQWNRDIRGHVVVENRAIYQFNTRYGLNTPHLQRNIFRRKNGYYQFKQEYLKDGLHVKNIIIRQWRVEFERVMAIMEERAGRARLE